MPKFACCLAAGLMVLVAASAPTSDPGRNGADAAHLSVDNAATAASAHGFDWDSVGAPRATTSITGAPGAATDGFGWD